MDGIGTFVIANKAAKVCAEYGVPVLAAGGVADEKAWQLNTGIRRTGRCSGNTFAAYSADLLITTRNGC